MAGKCDPSAATWADTAVLPFLCAFSRPAGAISPILRELAVIQYARRVRIVRNRP